jgi:hypothetical protein
VNTFVGVAPDWLDALATANDFTRSALIAGSLAVESAVPFLLAFGRTRRVGIALGALFHGFLGLRFYAFSTGLLALYALFVPAGLFDEARARIEALRARGGAAARLLSPATPRLLALVVVLGFAVSGSLVDETGDWAVVPRAGFPLFSGSWLVLVLVPLVWLLGSSRLAAGLAGGPPGRVMRLPALLVFPALVLFHGFSPYLGLRTVPAFSMFRTRSFSDMDADPGVPSTIFAAASSAWRRPGSVTSRSASGAEGRCARSPGRKRMRS